jgi:hypothetical protein
MHSPATVDGSGQESLIAPLCFSSLKSKQKYYEVAADIMDTTSDTRINHDRPPKDQRRPTVISTVTFFYASLYLVLYFQPQRSETVPWPSLPNLIAASLLLLGAVGAVLRRRWTVVCLVSGAVLVLLVCIVNLGLFLGMIHFGYGRTLGIVPLSALFIGLFPAISWPIFLIAWFSRRSIKTIVQSLWR